MKIELHYTGNNNPPIKILENRIDISDSKSPITELTMVKTIEKTTALQKIKEGVKGITKATLGIGLASKQEIEARRLICNACEFKKGPMCGACGCLLIPKTKVADEKCPKGFWGTAITIENKRSGGCGCGKNDY